MKRRTQCALAVSSLLIGLTWTDVTAQAPRERSLDVSIGVGGLFGEPHDLYDSGRGGAADIMFSVPVGRVGRLGVSYAAQSSLDNTDVCTVRGPFTPGKPCLKHHPLVTSWTAHVGREWRAAHRWSFRSYVGPSLVSVYRRDRSPSYWSTMGGASARADVVLRTPVNIIATMRGSLIPALPDRTKGTFAFGLGIGLH